MEAIRSSETSVLIRATRRHLPEDDNHQHILSAFYLKIIVALLTVYVKCKNDTSMQQGAGI
jgi:hypothetical protein